MNSNSINIGDLKTSGRLTIGGLNVSYVGNTAGLLMECLSNTELAVHDSGDRYASLMYYQGNPNNNITIGRDVGWGT